MRKTIKVDSNEFKRLQKLEQVIKNQMHLSSLDFASGVDWKAKYYSKLTSDDLSKSVAQLQEVSDYLGHFVSRYMTQISENEAFMLHKILYDTSEVLTLLKKVKEEASKNPYRKKHYDAF